MMVRAGLRVTVERAAGLRWTLRVALAALGALLLVRQPVTAQRLALGGDSLNALRAALPASVWPLAERHLAATSDTAARRAIEALRLDTTAGPLILAALARDADVQVRTRIVSALTNYAQRSYRREVIPALRERVRTDPSVEVVAAAGAPGRSCTATFRSTKPPTTAWRNRSGCCCPF